MPSSLPNRPQHSDIFCTVVDNFGDIGVCWRLARQLAFEHGFSVRLWVDDLGAFARLCPDLDPALGRQICGGVDIRLWPTPFPEMDDVADVVIEAFACQLPESYVAAMARRQAAPCWINLEYLSAEAWVADCHGLPSPHPQLPLTKHFFIPGFDEHSAGLLREHDLLAHHADFDAAAWWQAQGAAPQPEQLGVSLFAYENASVHALLDAWSAGGRSVRCLVTDSRVLASVADALQHPLTPGDSVKRGMLELRVLPFMPQQAYDDLLAACDINFVRGEDSLVRAIWAGKPFVWHIYPQSDAAHLVKLDAFLDRFCNGLSATADSALRCFWHSWNAETTSAGDWQQFALHLPEIAGHTLRWRAQLAQLTDLAATLADFCRNRL